MATPRKTATKRAPRTTTGAAAVTVGSGRDAALDVVVDELADDPDLAAEPVAASLTFTTPDDPDAAARAADPGTPFALDGERFLAYRPKRSVRQMLFAAASGSASDADRINAVLTWCDAALSPLANMRIKQRLLDRGDHLTLDHIVDVMTGLTEYWDAQESRAGRRAAGKRPAPRPSGPPR